LKSADAFIVEHPALEAHLKGLAKPAARIAMFTLGVDTGVFKPGHEDERQRWRKELSIAESDYVFLSPRGMADIYRQPEILEAFAEAQQHCRQRTILVFVGLKRGIINRHMQHKRRIEALAQSLNVTDSIRWIPQQAHKDMPGVYALADCVINYPSADTFPATLLEATACERLIVSSSLPCYENSYLECSAVMTKDDTKASLVNALIEVGNNNAAQYREQLRRGRSIMQEKYEQTNEKKRMLDLYQDMANASQLTKIGT